MSIHFWNSFSKKSWGAVPYPWKPSFGDLCFILYKYLLCCFKRKKCTVLLVGATLSIRSAFSHVGITYDLVDYSSNMVNITTPKNDTVQKVNLDSWLNIKPNRKYDFIVGDLVLNLLDEKSVGHFLNLYTDILTAGGVLILRTRIRSEKNIKDIQKITEKSLLFLGKKTLYTAFANLQTLSLFSENLAIKNREVITTKENKKLLSILETHFLHSDLKYHLHARAYFIKKKNAGYNLSLEHEHTPKGYADTFCFLVIRNNSL